MGNALHSILTRVVAYVAVAIAAGLLFLAGATELCDRVVETSSGESAYLVGWEANIERWLTEEDLRP